MASTGKKRPGVTIAEPREGRKKSSSKRYTAEDARNAGGDDDSFNNSRPRVTIEEAMTVKLPGRHVGSAKSNSAGRPNYLRSSAPPDLPGEEDSTSSICSSVKADRRNSRGSPPPTSLSENLTEWRRQHSTQSVRSNEDARPRVNEDSGIMDGKDEATRTRPQLRRASTERLERRPSDSHEVDPRRMNNETPLQTTFIKVVARVRPKIDKERAMPEGVSVLSDGSTIQVNDWRSNQRLYGVDTAIDSREDIGNTQAKFFSRAVQEFVTHSLQGYNICIFAYGHTGSGKTYTMLGDGARGDDHFGVLPRFIREVFTQHAQDPRHKVGKYCCEFAEVYNEQIRDLLAPMNSDRKRTIHVHPKHGVKVDGMSMSVVNSVEEALELVQFGNQIRTVATTTMNERSSRSHAIFTFKFQVEQEGTPNASDGPGKNNTKAIYESTVTFVDLAGHEDQETSTNMNTTFREMTYINKSLLYLATVINKLADGKYVRGSLADFRNSKLTLLLSQALIGNCRTLLVATLAPLQAYYDDSVSTLNFASAVKKVQTKPVLQNKNQRMMVKELEEEVRQLRSELVQAKGSGADKEKELEAATMWADYYKRSWEDAVRSSQEQKSKRMRYSLSFGLLADQVPRNDGGDFIPFFTKLSDDPALQGCCNYFLRKGISLVGNDGSECNIIVQGVGIRAKMCEVTYDDDEGTVSVKVCCESNYDEPPLVGSADDRIPRVLVNGDALEEGVSVRMCHGDSLILGYAHALRLVAPSAAITARATDSSALARTTINNLTLASAMAEIVEQKGNQFQQVLPYLQQLGTRAPESVVQAFLHSLHKVCPLVDEANVITKDIWSRSGVFFRLQVLMDLFDLGNYKPEIVICVLQNMSPVARFKYAVHTVMHHLKLAKKAGAKAEPNYNNPNRSIAAWMSIQSFTHPVFSRQNTPSEGSQDKSSSSSSRSSPRTPPPEVQCSTTNTPSPASMTSARRSRRDTTLMVGEARHPMVHALGLEDHMSVGKGSKKEPLLYVWSLEKFLRRLKEMRELYQDASEDQDNFKSLRSRVAAKPYLNPWREMTFADVKMLAEKGEDFTESSIVSRSRAVSKEKPASARSRPDLEKEAQVMIDEKRVSSPRETLGPQPAALKAALQQLNVDDGAEAAAGPSVAPPPPKAPKPSSREASPNKNDASPDTAEMLKALAAAAVSAQPPPAGPAAAAAASVAAAVTRAAEQPMKSTSEWQPVKAAQLSSEASNAFTAEKTWNAEASKKRSPPSKAETPKSWTAPATADGTRWSLAEAVRAYVAADPAPASTSQVAAAGAVTPSLGASPATGHMMRDLPATATPVQKSIMLPSPLNTTREEPDLTHLDLEELRSELVQCRLETGRMFTEQGRVAGLLERFERLLVTITRSDYSTPEASIASAPATVANHRPIAIAGLSSGESYALRSVSPQPSSPRLFAQPSSPRMASVGKRSPAVSVSPPRIASPAGGHCWVQRRQASSQEYIVSHRLMPPRRGTSSPSGRSSPALSPARQPGIVRTLSPVPSPPMLARAAAALFPATAGSASPVQGGSVNMRRHFSPQGVPSGVAPVLSVPTTVAPAVTSVVAPLQLPLNLPVPAMVSNTPIISSPGLSPSPSHQGTPRAPVRVVRAVSRSPSPMTVDGRTSPPRIERGIHSPPSPRQVEIDRLLQSPSSSSFLQVVTKFDRSDSPRLKGGRGEAARSESVGVTEVATGSSLLKSGSRSSQSAKSRGHERQDARQGVERSWSDQPFIDRSARSDRAPPERKLLDRPATERRRPGSRSGQG